MKLLAFIFGFVSGLFGSLGKKYKPTNRTRTYKLK
jgi:hypothetical protein